MIECKSDLLDTISDVFTTHDDARVIGAENAGGGLRVIGLVEVVAFSFEADRKSF